MDAAQAAQIKQMIKDEVNHHEDIDILRFEQANKAIVHMSDKIKDATALVHQHSIELQKLFDIMKHQGTLDQERRIRDLESYKNTLAGRISGIVSMVAILISLVANWVFDFFKGGK